MIPDINAYKNIEALFTPELLDLVRDPNAKYRRFPLVKKSGGLRWISEPVPMLKEAQREILSNLEIPSLTQTTGRGTHWVITGFIPGLSIIDNARPHVKKKVVLSMDLKDFFPSIRPIRLKDSLTPSLISMGVCPFECYSDFWITFKKVCFTSNGLPQGSPASPMLANHAALLGDKRIIEVLETYKTRNIADIAYTRYADDLTFSSDSDIPNDFVEWLVQNAGHIFGNINIKFAPHKIKFMRSHRRQIVTGIVVNEKMSIPRERRMKLRAIKHRIETKGIDSVDGYNFHEIMGELSYLHLTDKQKARDMIDMLLAI